jgi:hypothetical protein
VKGRCSSPTDALGIGADTDCDLSTDGDVLPATRIAPTATSGTPSPSTSPSGSTA